MADRDGQADTPRLHFGRISSERPHELTGILKGVISDGSICAQEAVFLLDWMQANADYLPEWPWAALFERLTLSLRDGQLDGEEERELLKWVQDHVGAGLTPDGRNTSSELLCDDPAPALVFVDRTFVITGTCASGPRKNVEAVIADRGGKVAGSISKKVDYLLIGGVGSRDWLMSTHGTKIIAAAELKKAGHPLAVIAERHLLAQLQAC